MAKKTKPHSNAPRNDLTAEFVRSILDYDPETGVFRWRERIDIPLRWRLRWNLRYAGKIAGSRRTNGSLEIRIFKRHYAAHRLAWLIMTGEWPENDIDHENTIKDDNRFENLRSATDSQNNWNCGPRKHNTSGIKGVSKHRDKWVAQINHLGRHYYLGIFETKEAAQQTYQEAAKRLHGEFARFS